MTDKETNTAPARVLIVEHESIITSRIEQLLTKLGYDVIGMASTGEEALRYVEEQPPDLVLMDTKLADDLDRVKTAAGTRAQFDVPIVYLSAHPEQMVMEQAKLIQPYGFLSKPVQDQELRATIEMALYKHRMEAQLRESEDKFRALTENSPDIIARFDRQCRHLYINPTISRYVELKPEDFIGKTNWDLGLPEEKIKVWERKMRHVFETGQPQEYEFEFEGLQGHTVFNTRLTPELTPDGQVQTVLSVTRDVTEHRQAEEALRVSEERFRMIFRRAPIGVGIADSEGNLTDCNAALAEMVGYSREELLRMNFADFTHPDDLEREWQLIDKLWAGEQTQYRMEKRYIHKDGHVIWVDVAASFFKGETGELTFGFAFVQDITERKQVEEALQASEKKYRNVVNNSLAGICIVQNGRFVFVNSRMMEFIGYERAEDIVGRPFWELVHPDDREMVRERGLKRERGERQPEHYEFKGLKKDGTAIWVELRSTLATYQGQPAIVGNIIDITERKRAEIEIDRRHRALTTLNTITTAVNQSLHLEDILNAALKETMAALDAEGGLIYLFDQSDQAFKPAVHRSIPPDVLREVTGFKIGQGLSGHVAASGQPLVTNLSADPRNISSASVRHRWRAYAGVPIKARGDLLGVMALIAHQKDRFDPQHVQLLAQIGDQIGVAIDNGRLYRAAQQEIAERQQMEKALRESEKKYRSYIDNAPDGIFITDASGNYVAVNPAACEMTGYTQEELLTKSIADIVTPEASEQATADFAYLKSSGRISTASPFVRKDGSRGYWVVEAVKLSNERLLGFTKDITQRKQAEEKLQAALAEKEVLLQETYHRIKNNLQSLVYLINLQIERLEHPDVHQALTELRGRVDAMTLIHKQLYQTGKLSSIDFGNYAEEMAVQIIHAMTDSREIHLHVEAEAPFLDVDAAIPCGLIINELVTNTLKHAFPEGWTGQPTIYIGFKREGTNYELTISDNGVGLPPGLDWQAIDSLGLKLVHICATRQLGGSIDVNRANGTMFKIKFERG